MKKWYAFSPKVEAETLLNGSSFQRDHKRSEQQKKSNNRCIIAAEVAESQEV